MLQRRFKKDDPVWVARLGPSYEGKRFKGEVAGVSVDMEDNGPYPAHYIVRLLEVIDPEYPFDFITITGACLDNRTE